MLSFGDRIESGHYKVHSKFNKVINFVRKGCIVSLVTEVIGAGPTNIVLNNLNFLEGDTLIIDKGYLVNNDFKISINNQKIYNSGINFKEVNYETLEMNLQYFESVISKRSPKKSLAFLLNDRRRNEFTTGFEKKFMKLVIRAVEEIIEGNVMKGVRIIKGVGFGLTPSGDDFLIGFLSGLHVVQTINEADYSTLMKNIYETARSKNQISNTLLSLAKEGFFFEKFKKLITSIINGYKKDILRDTEDFISIGETSGADICVGFLLACNKKSFD
jgi:hypothetical protein